MEAVIIRQARLYNVPPWQMEAECSEYWWEWLLAYDQASQEAQRQT